LKCPACPETTLVMADRQGVEIDYCPQCRGVWLDRGELDKLVERAVPAAPTVNAGRTPRPDFVDSDYRGGAVPHGQRRKSWLSDIFD
jgi:Zn-finger nucleic acid-binding protein